jgi:hypothetical protein
LYRAFHLAAQAALQQLHPGEDAIHQATDGPDDEAEHPAHPGDAEVEAAQGLQEVVQHVALGDQARGDLLGHIDPAPYGHGPLREMAELMGQHRAQLAAVQHIDQAQADLEVLLGRPKQVQRRQVVEHGRIDAGRDQHAVRPRRADRVGNGVQLDEEGRLVSGLDLQAVVFAAALAEEQGLEHEEGQQGGARGRQQGRETIAVVGDAGLGQAPGRPGKPAGQTEIGSQEAEQRGHGQPGAQPVAAGRGSCGRGWWLQEVLSWRAGARMALWRNQSVRRSSCASRAERRAAP